MLEMDFNLYDHNFCESSIYSDGQHPEYLNAISSLFISFIGINGLFKSRLSLLLSMCYSTMAVNGVLSYFYHYYNSIGWGLLDRMSMILLGLNTTYLFTNHLKRILVFSDVKSASITNVLIHVVIISYYSLLLTVAGLHKEELFNILFGLFLASLIVYMYFIDKNAQLFNVNDKIVSLGWKGVKYIFCSAFFWIATENLCYRFSFIKYLFGHVWWHVFVSYGGYLISLVPNYMQMINKINQKETIIEISTDQFNMPFLEYKSI